MLESVLWKKKRSLVFEKQSQRELFALFLIALERCEVEGGMVTKTEKEMLRWWFGHVERRKMRVLCIFAVWLHFLDAKCKEQKLKPCPLGRVLWSPWDPEDSREGAAEY